MIEGDGEGRRERGIKVGKGEGEREGGREE